METKTKKQIRTTPLLNSVTQPIILLLAIFLLSITTDVQVAILVVMSTLAYFSVNLGAVAGFRDSCLSRYRIVRKRYPESGDVYFIQSKPLWLFFFLPWEGKENPLFGYKKDGDKEYFKNTFKTQEEAENQIKILKNRNEVKKLFLIIKIEVCS